MTSGIHHITAIASNGQKNVSFYTHTLGLRLVKKSVNQDDVGTYHLFFGDKLGHPGMDLTFFIFRPPMQGRRGNGLVTTISLAVPAPALPFWERRLNTLQVKNDGISERFGGKRIRFYDSDDQQLEIVGVTDQEYDSTGVWTTNEISQEHAIRCFHSATLSVTSRSAVEPILTTVFGYTPISSEGHVHLFHIPSSHRAQYLEVSEEPSSSPGLNAAGTVHHIAFRAADAAQQAAMRDIVVQLGLYPTEVINRFYFQSVYFRTPAGILFEIATDAPGFTADETEEQLGKKLALPPFLEHARTMIEKHLPPLSAD